MPKLVANPAYVAAPYQVGYVLKNGVFHTHVYSRVRAFELPHLPHLADSEGLDEIPDYITHLPDIPTRLDIYNQIVPPFIEKE